MASDGDKASVVRSPKYPAIGLSEAVEKIRQLYAKDKTAGSPMDAAVRHMGYKSRSGPANMTIAAVRRFGLADSISGRLVPTKRAVSILVLPDSDPRRLDALREAALAPSLYSKLYDQYRAAGHLPSKDSLEQELMLSGEFNHNSVKALVKDFISSLSFAGLTDANGVILGTSDKNEDEGDDNSPDPEDEDGKVPPKKRRQMQAGTREDVYTSAAGDFVLQWPDQASEEDVSEFEEWVKLLIRKIKRISSSSSSSGL